MQLLIVISTGILGLIVGSFLNVVILRINTGKGLGGRSMCLSCNKTLAWYELIPVVSFIAQRGVCRNCQSRISYQYPLVELITGIAFASVAFHYPLGMNLILWLIMISLSVVIGVYDYYHHMIPVKPLGLLAITGLLLGGHLIGAIVVALPFVVLWFISLGKWIGFGDVEIMAIMGLTLGIADGFSAVILAFWIACLVMIPVIGIMKRRKKKRNPQIPFGPFLLIGMYLVGVWGFSIISFLSKMVNY